MSGLTGKVLCIVLLLGLAAPVHAIDPVLMFLLSAAREMVFAGARDKPPGSFEPPAAEITYPGTVLEPALLQRLIDESFGYLSEAQRREVFDSLHTTLMDPKNAAVRGPMIEYFADRALAVRDARNRLAMLTQAEKMRLAAEFGKQVAALPDEEAAQVADLLRRHLLPVPSDLNEMLLAALGDR